MISKFMVIVPLFNGKNVCIDINNELKLDRIKTRMTTILKSKAQEIR